MRHFRKGAEPGQPFLDWERVFYFSGKWFTRHRIAGRAALLVRKGRAWNGGFQFRCDEVGTSACSAPWVIESQMPGKDSLMSYKKKPSSKIDLNAICSSLRTTSNAHNPCSECESLEHECQLAAANISRVVSTRFKSFSEKLQQLHKWQDVRAKAMEKLYHHKSSHFHQQAA
jgi:hypothetical protein